MPEPGQRYPAWVKTVDEVCMDYDTHRVRGLASKDVDKLREQYGYNELEKEVGKPLWRLVLEQFDDMLVKILLLAAVVSFGLAIFEGKQEEEGLRAYIEPFVIVLILILNAVVGVWQESNAEKALDALKELQTDTAKTVRDGKLISALPARELVPGDLIELTVGDRVPADARVAVMRTALLQAEQSSLTGEPVAVNKGLEPIADADCELQGKENMLFASTAIAHGHCFAVVTAIGMDTEIGKIQSSITAASLEEEETPLKRKLNDFGELLAKIIFAICILVWLINYHHFLELKFVPGTWRVDWAGSSFSLSRCTYYFKIAVALAVAAIPEGLPAVITTCLALGTRKMAKQNAIVRKLPSVETLGCTSVICSDKTGTLTTNQMSATTIVTLSGAPGALKQYTVEGTTYNPDAGRVSGLVKLDAALQAMAEVCALCNNATVECKGGAYRAVGAPTEAALAVLAEKLGVSDATVNARLVAARKADPEGGLNAVCNEYRSRFNNLGVLEFDRNRKSMSVICSATPAAAAANGPATSGTVHQLRSGRTVGGDSNGNAANGNLLFVKGAAECIVDRCTTVLLPDGSVVPLEPASRGSILASVERMAEKGLRILALARKTSGLGPLATYDGVDTHGEAHKLLQDPSTYESIESGMTFIGLAGLQDPPRPEVAGAIEQCSRAGIRVIVITGDNKKTAEAVCRNIGVFGPEESLLGKSFTGREFVELPASRQLEILGSRTSCVFSRAEPQHKQDIVKLLKQQGEVTAMTGDGVNDAPALKLADIGIAMGIAGTEVAKGASDMVLADDNFSTIVAAVAEGRSIYNNMKAFIRYMISSNMGEVASIFLTAALGLPENMIPVQLLWVNLVTDGPPATALGFNPPDVDIMEKPPRNADEQLITPWVLLRYLIIGSYVGCATVGAFVAWYLYEKPFGIDLSGDGHSTVTWYQLTHFEECHEWKDFNPSFYTAGSRTITFATPCEYFDEGKVKASTLALSVLVAIEMFNAYNALSEDNSLLTMPPWINPWLTVATALSLGLHCVILYVPFLADVFSIVPLSFNEWLLVLALALPVILLDEVLKFIGRILHKKKAVVERPKTE